MTVGEQARAKTKRQIDWETNNPQLYKQFEEQKPYHEDQHKNHLKDDCFNAI
jgi:hypothetical protein